MSADAADAAALPYHEPDIMTILILTSFLLLLNVINHILDRIIYVGLIGQVFLGIAFGTPGAKLLGREVETVVVDLGYLGLLLLVCEGGLTTSFNALKANLVVSSCVAATGIALPIGFSYVLTVLSNATPLQAFAAGAALCSTSLGTTFTVMQSSGLSTTRMGVVLTSAAMMDDVVGLVMVQVISNLGAGSSSFSAITIVRPVFVSLALAVAVPALCWFVVLPVTKWSNRQRARSPNVWWSQVWLKQQTAFVVHTLILVSMVTGATYAGTSNLFAAYLAGAAISWWDSEVPHNVVEVIDIKQIGTKRSVVESNVLSNTSQPHVSNTNEQLEGIPPVDPNPVTISTDDTSVTVEDPMGMRSVPEVPPRAHDTTTGHAIFATYYSQPLQRILKPFFFASIGFSIPITRMFTGTVIWRGIVYTTLMSIGKMACGIWLVRFKLPTWIKELWQAGKPSPNSSSPVALTSIKPDASALRTTKPASPKDIVPHRTTANSSARIDDTTTDPTHQTARPAKPVSLYPSTIVGCAMVARGEIGFLISSLAEANGIFGDQRNGELFLIVTWAIMLCTIVGPVMVGAMVNRLKKKVSRGKQAVGQRDVLGVWGLK